MKIHLIIYLIKNILKNDLHSNILVTDLKLFLHMALLEVSIYANITAEVANKNKEGKQN